MPKFNTPRQTTAQRTATINRAGGDAYKESDELAFASLILTSLLKDQFYRKEETTLTELRSLMTKVDPVFAAKAAHMARHVHGLRSITHVVAGELAGVQFPSKRDFFAAIPRRVDDITEILAYWFSKADVPHGTLPNGVKYGLARAFDKFDAYQLAKYRGEGKAVSLIDAVNLLHPKGTDQNREALKALIKGTLKNTDTWEAKRSAGDKEAFGTLLRTGRLGYLALLKNLRNILKDGDADTKALALERLTDPVQIRKSGVLPFQFVTAYFTLAEESSTRDVLTAISRAVDISLENIPVLPGRTLIALDASGSMQGSAFDKNRFSAPIYVGSVFALGLFKKLADADLMLFHETGTYANMSADTPVMSASTSIINKLQGKGTNFECVFQTAYRAVKGYDRIIFLSDMQGWMGATGTKLGTVFNEYKRALMCDPTIFSFDLTGYGTLMFPEPKVYALAGISEKIFDVMSVLDGDRQAFVNTIKAHDWNTPVNSFTSESDSTSGDDEQEDADEVR